MKETTELPDGAITASLCFRTDLKPRVMVHKYSKDCATVFIQFGSDGYTAINGTLESLHVLARMILGGVLDEMGITEAEE